MERTLLIFKPDVVQRQITGELISRFEKKGFKIVGMKMVLPTVKQVGEHYIDEEKYLIGVGDKAKKGAIARGEDVTDWNSLKVGEQIRKWNVDYLTCGPVLAIVMEGFNIITGVRKMLGTTSPADADVGTIRMDYSLDCYALADEQARSTRSMIHASDSVESAEREIPLWFKKEELVDYKTAIEMIFYDAGWSNN
ncbi:TPA: nucleoside-diphosphate kinase [Patescibacteria group bacterium]|nr:nucleoside-diphosphate kinase [Patescibacteria group bacterium]